jgi:hypothetical protein
VGFGEREGFSGRAGHEVGESVAKLKELSAGHKKIILYANPGKEGLYKELGFKGIRRIVLEVRWNSSRR